MNRWAWLTLISLVVGSLFLTVGLLSRCYSYTLNHDEMVTEKHEHTSCDDEGCTTDYELHYANGESRNPSWSEWKNAKIGDKQHWTTTEWNCR